MIHHHAVIATTWSKEAAAAMADWLHENAPEDQVTALDSQLGVYTVILGPDGSKEGWPPSDAGDVLRTKFISELTRFDHEDGSSPFHWVEVGYGECGMKVVHGNCQNCYGDSEYHNILK